MKPTSRDYCQFLISTQTNYTQTYFAEHQLQFAHDANLGPADFHGRYTSDVCPALEDRAIPQGNQAGAGHREMSVSSGAFAEEPYCLCNIGLGASVQACRSIQDECLCIKERHAVGIHQERTSLAHYSHGAYLT
jgi:hypothetical protein